MCVDDGRFKQPHLAPVRLIGLWGWVTLHTCTISNQCAPHLNISTHVQGETLLHSNIKHRVVYQPYNKTCFQHHNPSSGEKWVLDPSTLGDRGGNIKPTHSTDSVSQGNKGFIATTYASNLKQVEEALYPQGEPGPK